jgi:hypothetical protein
MKSEIIPYNLIQKLAPGVANRQSVLNHLGKPKVVAFGNDFKVIYKYPNEGVEVVIRVGEKVTCSIVRTIVFSSPLKNQSTKYLDVGMSFSEAESICNSHYELEIDTEDSRIYSLGDPKLNIQIWEKKGLLEKIEFFQ